MEWWFCKSLWLKEYRNRTCTYTDSDCSYKYRSYLICVIRLIHDKVVNYKITYYASVVTKLYLSKVILCSNKDTELAHTKWLWKYHIVFTSKYRCKVTYNLYRYSLCEIIRRLYQYKGIKIIEGKLMADYVHMRVLVSAKILVSSFMWYFKDKSA